MLAKRSCISTTFFLLKSLIIHEATTKKINTVDDVWKSEEEFHKLGQLSP